MGWGGCYELESFLISNPWIIYSVGCCGWGPVISGVTSEEEVVLYNSGYAIGNLSLNQSYYPLLLCNVCGVACFGGYII